MRTKEKLTTEAAFDRMCWSLDHGEPLPADALEIWTRSHQANLLAAKPERHVSIELPVPVRIADVVLMPTSEKNVGGYESYSDVA